MFFKILYGHLNEYMLKEDMLLLLWTLDPTNSSRILLTSFACILRFASELTSLSPFNLSGLDVANALFLYSQSFKDKDKDKDREKDKDKDKDRDKDLPLNLIGGGRPRASSKVGLGVSPSSPLQSIATSSSTRPLSLPLPSTVPELLPTGVRLSKSVILSILSSVCTSPESVKRLSSLLDPFFFNNMSAEKYESEIKNSFISDAMEGKYSTVVAVIKSTESDIRQNSKMRESVMAGNVSNQSTRVFDILQAVSADRKRRASIGNKKQINNQKGESRSNSVSSVGGHNAKDIQTSSKVKIYRSTILTAAAKNLLCESDEGMEMETAKVISLDTADDFMSEKVILSQNTEESKSNIVKSLSVQVTAVEVQELLTVEVQVPVPVAAVEAVEAAAVEAAAVEAAAAVAAVEAAAVASVEYYSVDRVCHFISHVPSLQQLLESEVRSVMCQLVTASTRYLTETKATRRKSEG